MVKSIPSISILIPTLNADRVLRKCLKAIEKQDYPKDKFEIIISDGGSSDRTLEIARKQNAKIVPNKLKTGEAGKAAALKHATGDLIALIDSDNILPNINWLKRMVEPFGDDEILGSEPWQFCWRKKDSLVNRYCALIGANDPYCYFIGNYDKKSYLSNKWTGLKMEEQDKGNFLKMMIKGKILPTIGANGTIWRRKVLVEAVGNSEYLFDTDIPYVLLRTKTFFFAKVKVGIIHLFCNHLNDFIRKQRRRVRDFASLQQQAKRESTYQMNYRKQIWFIFATVTILPLICQTIKGFWRKPDIAWFFHPLACWLTLVIYSQESLLAKFTKISISRNNWKQ